MKTVLLVEDDMFISDMMETKLKQVGFNVVTEADGASVIAKLNEVKPDLILLDLMLPNRHGFEILEEIRSLKEWATLPVIILSNENGTDVETRARHLDAQYFFKAMTDISEMESIINQALA